MLTPSFATSSKLVESGGDGEAERLADDEALGDGDDDGLTDAEGETDGEALEDGETLADPPASYVMVKIGASEG